MLRQALGLSREQKQRAGPRAPLSAVLGIMKLANASRWVGRDPTIRGGIPTMKGTRIGAYEAASVANEDGLDSALAVYPTLKSEEISYAILYAAAHPRVVLNGFASVR